jgi:hypothetical protein
MVAKTLHNLTPKPAHYHRRRPASRRGCGPRQHNLQLNYEIHFAASAANQQQKFASAFTANLANAGHRRLRPRAHPAPAGFAETHRPSATPCVFRRRCSTRLDPFEACHPNGTILRSIMARRLLRGAHGVQPSRPALPHRDSAQKYRGRQSDQAAPRVLGP